MVDVALFGLRLMQGLAFGAVQHDDQRSGFSMAVRANRDCPPYNDPRRESIVEEKND